MRVAVVHWRSLLRRSWRQALVLCLIGGLLGGVALASLAGARRTASAYGRYLQATNASDAAVNIPGEVPGASYLGTIAAISALPGVASHAAFAGLNAFPVVRGKINDSFLTDDVIGSIDGAYFRQDKLVPLAGKLPAAGSTTSLVLSPGIARLFGVGVGGRVTYAFVKGEDKPQYQYRSYTVAAIAQIPPVLIDQSDQASGAILPPAATRQLFQDYTGYCWVALRLTHGAAGIAALQGELTTLTGKLARQVKQATGQQPTDLTFSVQRVDLVRGNVQQAIKPEFVALTVFGLIAALALLILVLQGLFQMTARFAPDADTLRALGATRVQVTGMGCLPGLVVVAGITVLAGVIAVALSPLAPVGPVRSYDPARGVAADPLVLGAGLPAIFLLVLGVLIAVTIRATRPVTADGMVRAGATSLPAARLPAVALIGIRNALTGGTGRQSVPALTTLGGAVVAVTAMVTAVVFSGSLTQLSSHPARYGWNWDVLIQAEGSYGSFLDQSNRDPMVGLLAGQRIVAGWSELAFAQLPVDGRYLPAVALERHGGSAEPPTITGQPLSGDNQVELGTATLAELGKKIGDTVTVGSPPYARKMTITGSVTLPSIGVAETDHVSLGRGLMMSEGALLAAFGATGTNPRDINVAQPIYPSVAVIDFKPGTTAQQRTALINRITSANPDGTPGGTYALPPQQASVVYNADQLGSQPVALAAGLAAAALLSLSMTILSLVRRRRREFALLKALGMTSSQLRAVIAWQTSVTLLIAVAAGVPLGIILGRFAWQRFAGSLGVVPFSVTPALLLIAGAVVLILLGNLLASLPGTVAARTQAGLVLKAE